MPLDEEYRERFVPILPTSLILVVGMAGRLLRYVLRSLLKIRLGFISTLRTTWKKMGSLDCQGAFGDCVAVDWWRLPVAEALLDRSRAPST